MNFEDLDNDVVDSSNEKHSEVEKKKERKIERIDIIFSQKEEKKIEGTLSS